MADINQNKAEQYRKERKERLAKAAKKNAKNIEKKTAARSLIKKVVAIVLAAVIGLSCVVGILNYSGVMYSLIKVGAVGSHKISMAEYKYYYFNAYNNFLQMEQQYSYMGQSSGSNYDLTLSPEEQTSTTTDENGNEITWVEYFRKAAMKSAQQTYAYYQEAEKANIELDEAELKEIDDYIEQVREAANNAGKTDASDENQKGYSINAYLRMQYGNGITKSFIKKEMKIQSLANKFCEERVKTLKNGYSDDEVKAVFDNDPDSYLRVDLRLYQFNFETLTKEDKEKDKDFEKRQKEADEKVKADADKMAKVKDEKSFVNLAKELNKDNTSYDVDTSTLLRSYLKTAPANSDGSTPALSTINPDLAEWAFNAKTKKNSVKKIEVKGEDGTVTGYIVAMLTNPKHDLPTVTVRHILFTTVDTSTMQPLEDDKITAAEANAKKTFDEWKAGGSKEEAFIDYAKELSEDPGSKADGGLIEDVYPGAMDKNFDAWIFDDARKAGDCEIIKSTYGYHIMYFVAKGERTYSDVTIRTELASEDFTEEATALLDGTEYFPGLGPRLSVFTEKDILKKIKKLVARQNAQSASSYGY